LHHCLLGNKKKNAGDAVNPAKLNFLKGETKN